MKNLDLDVDHPDKVARILRNAAEAYGAAEVELSSAWQDPGAGRPWGRIARILEKAADQVDRVT